jgi:hypothetical protein
VQTEIALQRLVTIYVVTGLLFLLLPEREWERWLNRFRAAWTAALAAPTESKIVFDFSQKLGRGLGLRETLRLEEQAAEAPDSSRPVISTHHCPALELRALIEMPADARCAPPAGVCAAVNASPGRC